LLAFAAHACSLAALGGEDVGVAGVGVAPSQVFLHAPDEHGVVRGSEPPMTKVRSGPNCASMGLAHDA
jgi:hypothetical protein